MNCRNLVSRRALLAAAAIAVGALSFAGAANAQQKTAQPKKIVVYGGSGNIGSRIVAEAAARGHIVTVVDRNPRADRAPPGVKLIQGDALDARDIAKNIEGQDVVVSSVIVRPTPTPDFVQKVVEAMVAAQRSQTGPQKTRLLVVGGAGSLYNAEGKRMVDNLPDSLPEGVRNEVRSAAAALDYLYTVKDTSWTFFSPAGNISPGTRTGKFRVGGDQIIIDEQGQSRISMEDFAVAALDEIENPKHINKRFTVGY